MRALVYGQLNDAGDSNLFAFVITDISEAFRADHNHFPPALQGRIVQIFQAVQNSLTLMLDDEDTSAADNPDVRRVDRC